MALKKFNPTSPGRRHMTHLTFDEITKSTPERSLTEPLKKTGGRDSRGRITVRFIGGGHKQRYRTVDFKRDKPGVPAKVAAVEYDPNRSARLALLHYSDGEKRYILWPDGLAVGSEVVAGETAEVNVGNALPLRKIPLGTVIHNIELKIGKGGQMARSAGSFAQVVASAGDVNGDGYDDVIVGAPDYTNVEGFEGRCAVATVLKVKLGAVPRVCDRARPHSECAEVCASRR